MEGIQKWEEKEFFKEYAEDFNTSTLPHEKYYAMEKWHAAEMERQRKEGNLFPKEMTTFNDEAGPDTPRSPRCLLIVHSAPVHHCLHRWT
jgi:hypothetical protein